MEWQHHVNPTKVGKFNEVDPRKPSEEHHGKLIEDLVEALLFKEEPRRTFKIDSVLTGQLREYMIQFLRKYRDVFA